MENLKFGKKQCRIRESLRIYDIASGTSIWFLSKWKIVDLKPKSTISLLDLPGKFSKIRSSNLSETKLETWSAFPSVCKSFFFSSFPRRLSSTFIPFLTLKYFKHEKTFGRFHSFVFNEYVLKGVFSKFYRFHWSKTRGGKVVHNSSQLFGDFSGAQKHQLRFERIINFYRKHICYDQGTFEVAGKLESFHAAFGQIVDTLRGRYLAWWKVLDMSSLQISHESRLIPEIYDCDRLSREVSSQSKHLEDATIKKL